MSNVAMRRAFSELTAKTHLVLLEVEDEEGMYVRDGDGWLLLQGDAAPAVGESDAAALSGVDEPR